MSRLVEDAIAARERRRQPNRRRIGNCEFREPDYSQILTWASAVGISPEDLVAKLQEAEEFTVSEGAITVSGQSTALDAGRAMAGAAPGCG